MEETSSAAMLATKRSAGVTPEVNLREHVTHTPPPSANKAAHSGFEIHRRHYQKSKTGVSVAPQKGLMSSKNFFKKKYKGLIFFPLGYLQESSIEKRLTHVLVDRYFSAEADFSSARCRRGKFLTFCVLFHTSSVHPLHFVYHLIQHFLT